MDETLDPVERYAAMVLDTAIRQRTVLVEGTTDVDLFKLAVDLELKKNNIDLLDDDLSIVSAGSGDHGGANGVIRELIALRGMARTCLLPNGSLRYRFIGLLDNDIAGKRAIKTGRTMDTSIIEYRDLFRLQPVMPLPGNLDPGTVKKSFERENADYKELYWELEDLLPQDFIEVFRQDNPQAINRRNSIYNKVHQDFTPDGKAQFHRFIREYANHKDLGEVINVLKAIRYYLNLPIRPTSHAVLKKTR